MFYSSSRCYAVAGFAFIHLHILIIHLLSQLFIKISFLFSAVLKMLEGRISPGIGLKSPKMGLSRKIIQSPLSQVLSSSKNPNGVWV